MNKTVKRAAAVATVALGLVVTSVTPSYADFAAWNGTYFQGQLFYGSGDPGYYDVADDLAESANNTNFRAYYGRSYTGFRDANNRVFTFQARTEVNTLGSANNTIDFFYFD